MRHMATLGYAVVKKEDNPYWCCGAEFLLIKVEQRQCDVQHAVSTSRGATPPTSLDEVFAILQVSSRVCSITVMFYVSQWVEN